MLSSVPLDYSQRILIDKINQYQKLKGRDLISTKGYCHGLAVVWAIKIFEGKVRWFYATEKDIIRKLPAELDEVNYEKFLALVEWAQIPIKYDYMVTQAHLSKITGMQNIKSIGFSGSFKQFCNRIRPKKHPAIYIITQSINHEGHTIAVFHYAGFYHVYDANYESGEAKVFDAKEKAAEEILRRMMRILQPARQFTIEEQVDLDINFIPLHGILQHPSDEVVIDMPNTDDKMPQAQNDGSSYRCAIL